MEPVHQKHSKSIPVEGTIASLSMLLTAGASLVIVPLFLSWIH